MGVTYCHAEVALGDLKKESCVYTEQVVQQSLPIGPAPGVESPDPRQSNLVWIHLDAHNLAYCEKHGFRDKLISKSDPDGDGEGKVYLFLVTWETENPCISRPLIIKDRSTNDNVPRYLLNCCIPIVASGQSRQHPTLRALPAVQLHDFEVPENVWVLLLTLKVPRRHGALKLIAEKSSLDRTSEDYFRHHLAELGRVQWEAMKLLGAEVVSQVVEGGNDYEMFDIGRVALKEYFDRMDMA